MKKRLWSVLLTLALLIGLAPGLTPDARAAMPDSFTLTVGGEALTAEHTATTDDTASISVSGTTVTLTLTDFNYEGAGPAIAFSSDSNYSLNIELSGENSIIASSEPGISFASYNGYLTFLGSGSLTVNATDGSSDGIYNLYNTGFALSEGMVLENAAGEQQDWENEIYYGSYAKIYTPSATPTPADPSTPADPTDPGDLGGITGEDFSNLSFTVSMSNKSSYTGARDPSSYTYRVAYQPPAENAPAYHPIVTFAANGADILPLSFARNSGGTAEITSVLLAIAKPEGVAQGVYSYTLSQAHGADQHNAGFHALNSTALDGAYVTAYTLKLYVNEAGKITQAILTDGVNKHTGFEIEYGRADGAYTVTLAKRSVSGVEGTFYFNVEFTLPENHTSADIRIEGWDGTLSFSDGRATAQNVPVVVGGQADITGIPAGTVLRVKETGALDVYKVTSVVEHLSDAVNLASGREADGYTTCGTVTGNGGIITYYNELGEISLTGVSLRYAPYLAMLGAGLAVSGLSAARRREEEL